MHLAENLDANFMCIKISDFPSRIIMGMLADPFASGLGGQYYPVSLPLWHICAIKLKSWSGVR